MSIVFGILALFVVIALAVHSSGKWKGTLSSVAARYDLQMTNGGLLRADSVHGALDGVPITVDSFSRGSGDSRTTYSRIRMTPRMTEGLGLKREGAFLGQLFKGEDLVIGDPLFDGQVIVRGPQRAVRALLNQPTRDAVAQSVTNGVAIENGAITWTKRGHASLEALCGAIDDMRALAQRLSQPADAAALAEIVRNDMLEVALEALRVMPAGAIRDALDAEIIESRDDDLVMTAAPRVGAAAAPGVLAVLENPRNSDGLRARALTWLGEHTDAVALAQQHLIRPRIAEAALTILARAQAIVPLDTLGRLIKADAEVAPAALRVARNHGVDAEAFLIDALEHADDDVARAAADSLGLVGTPAAVMPLRTRIKGRFVNGALKSAALAAIETIQGRVGAIGGGLSVVAESATGRLSEARRVSEDRGDAPTHHTHQSEGDG